jgi:hypothetical protein
MQLWIVEHFHLHKKIPLLMNHNIWKNCTLWFITTGTFLWRCKCSTIHTSYIHNFFKCFDSLLQVPFYSELQFAEVTFYKIHTLLEFMSFDLAWNSTTDVFDQIPHSCHFVLHIAVNTNVSEGFVFTAIWSTYMEGRPADRFVLDIAVNTILQN